MIPCVDDLIHLEDPIEEDSVVRALQARFFNQKYFVSTLKYSISDQIKFLKLGHRILTISLLLIGLVSLSRFFVSISSTI